MDYVLYSSFSLTEQTMILLFSTIKCADICISQENVITCVCS